MSYHTRTGTPLEGTVVLTLSKGLVNAKQRTTF